MICDVRISETRPDFRMFSQFFHNASKSFVFPLCVSVRASISRPIFLLASSKIYFEASSALVFVFALGRAAARLDDSFPLKRRQGITFFGS